MYLNVSGQSVIRAKYAYKHLGQEVTVRDKYWFGFNSSYLQIACLKLGPDSTHVQLTVYIQGKFYSDNRFGVIYKDGTIQLTGIIYKGKDGLIYMNTSR